MAEESRPTKRLSSERPSPGLVGARCPSRCILLVPKPKPSQSRDFGGGGETVVAAVDPESFGRGLTSQVGLQGLGKPIGLVEMNP